MTHERIDELEAKARAGNLTPEDEAELFAALREAIIYRDKFQGALQLSNKYNKKWRARIAELEADNAALREDRDRFIQMASDWMHTYIGAMVMWKGAEYVERMLENPNDSHSYRETKAAIEAARKERPDA